jgi:hypothetical protein
MKRMPVAMILLSLVFLVVACGGNLNKLNGKWVGDGKESMKLSGEDTGSENEMAIKLAEAMFSAIGVEINARAKKITVSMGNNQNSDDFKVLSSRGKKISLQTQNGIIICEFINDNLVIMGDEENKRFVLKRSN